MYRILQITRSKGREGREKPNFIVILLNPLFHDLKNNQSILLRDDNLNS